MQATKSETRSKELASQIESVAALTKTVRATEDRKVRCDTSGCTASLAVSGDITVIAVLYQIRTLLVLLRAQSLGQHIVFKHDALGCVCVSVCVYVSE